MATCFRAQLVRACKQRAAPSALEQCSNTRMMMHIMHACSTMALALSIKSALITCDRVVAESHIYDIVKIILLIHISMMCVGNILLIEV